MYIHKQTPMKLYPLLLSLLMLAACGQGGKKTSLEWPELKTADQETEELEGLLAGDPDPAALAEHLPHVKEALETLLASGIPPGAANRELVEQKLEELRSLADSLGDDPDALPALHPLIASIMEEAGMPHVHDEDHDHGHDHGHGHHHDH